MSIKLMTAVWSISDISSTDKLVLLALADNANDEGYCWPSTLTISRKASLTDRAVRISYNRLTLARYLSIQERTGRSNVFRVTPERGSPLNVIHPTPEHHAGVPLNVIHPTPERRSPITIIEPSLEPSRESKTLAGSEAPDPEFLDFKLVYPDRAGSQEWRKAMSGARARLREGYTWTQMRDGAVRYATYVRSTGSEGTQYVKRAGVFLGPDLHFLEPWTLPKTKSEVVRDQNINVSLEWLDATS